MKQFLTRMSVTLVLCAGSICAQNKPLSNKDIVEMSRQSIPASTIIAVIQSAPATFDVSPEGITALHSGGVTEAVLNQMIRAGTRSKLAASFGVATGTFPVKDAVGQTVHYTGWIKTENVQNGYAGLWWRVDGEQDGKRYMLAFDNSQTRAIGGDPAAGNGVVRGATGTTQWTRYDFELPVAAGARNINFGVLFTGTGTAWFDALRIELSGVPYLKPELFDLDFESVPARGFYTGGNGYKVNIDNTISWAGKQSLKMQSVGDGGEAKSLLTPHP